MRVSVTKLWKHLETALTMKVKYQLKLFVLIAVSLKRKKEKRETYKIQSKVLQKEKDYRTIFWMVEIGIQKIGYKV